MAAYNEEAEKAWNLVMSNIDNLSGKEKELALLYKNAGRALVGNGSVHDYIIHEMGHHVQWNVLDTKINNAMGSSMSIYAPRISGYANASKSEYIAESFAAYIKGETKLLDPDFVKAINEYNKPLEKVARSSKIKATRTISGHSGTPKQSNPNDVIDHLDENGSIDSRGFYDSNGMKNKDIHTNDHGNPKWHNYGIHGEHAHDYEWNEDGSLNNKTTRELTKEERKDNGGIL